MPEVPKNIHTIGRSELEKIVNDQCAKIKKYEIALSAIQHELHMEGGALCGACNQTYKIKEGAYCPGCDLEHDEIAIAGKALQGDKWVR